MLGIGTCHVEKEIDPAEPRLRPLDQLVELFIGRYVRLDEQRSLAEVRREPSSRLLLHVRYGDQGAFAHESACESGAEAARAPRDDCNRLSNAVHAIS
jgi:hypothetical protein